MASKVQAVLKGGAIIVRAGNDAVEFAADADNAEVAVQALNLLEAVAGLSMADISVAVTKVRGALVRG